LLQRERVAGTPDREFKDASRLREQDRWKEGNQKRAPEAPGPAKTR
jgi:hypothetical protein